MTALSGEYPGHDRHQSLVITVFVVVVILVVLGESKP